MPSLYEYMNVNIILSNNSMALRIRYSIFFIVFKNKNIRLCIERGV